MADFTFIAKAYTRTVTIDVSENCFRLNNVIETPLCKFDGLDDISFSVHCQICTYDGNEKLAISLKPASQILFRCCIGAYITLDCTNPVHFTYEMVKLACKDGFFKIVVTATYSQKPLLQGAAPASLQIQTHQLIGNDEDSFDGKVVVDKEEIMIHRGFLSIVSPVFKAMFDHNTKESKDGIVNIKDMDATVVKESINLLYGHNVELKTIPQAIGILQFFEKYLIKGPIDHLVSWISDNMNLTDFETVIKHAWDHSSEKLQKRCRAFFYQNPRFAFTEEYRQLPFDIIVSLSTVEAQQANSA
uniref:BTB domain-containing protein n=1 Tax=Panagrellus redivivus TaxID=6233 RepID=A0A7E4ZUC2_PANRE